MKIRMNQYNDGVVCLYRDTERKTDFNAKKNVQGIEDMEFVVRLDYGELSKRQQDIEFADQHGFSLTQKVKTRFVAGVDNKCKAVIDGFLYDVAYLDTTRTEMFLYLEGVKPIAQRDTREA